MLIEKQKQAKDIDVNNVIDVVNSGITITKEVAPILSVLFNKIKAFVDKIGKNDPDSPRNVRYRLAAVEAKDNLQKEVNRLFDERIAELEKLAKKHTDKNTPANP